MIHNSHNSLVVGKFLMVMDVRLGLEPLVTIHTNFLIAVSTTGPSALFVMSLYIIVSA